MEARKKEGRLFLISSHGRTVIPDDYWNDYLFGRYLAHRRKRLNLTYFDLECKTKIREWRIKEILKGTPEKGATKKECLRLAHALDLDETEVIKKAIGL